MTRTAIAIALTILGTAASTLPAAAFSAKNEMPEAGAVTQIFKTTERRADAVYNAAELQRRDLKGNELVTVSIIPATPQMDRIARELR